MEKRIEHYGNITIDLGRGLAWCQNWCVSFREGGSHIEIKKVIRSVLPMTDKDIRRLEGQLARTLWA